MIHPSDGRTGDSI